LRLRRQENAEAHRAPGFPRFVPVNALHAPEAFALGDQGDCHVQVRDALWLCVLDEDALAALDDPLAHAAAQLVAAGREVADRSGALRN
jgi:hypothetical protein